MKIVSSRISLLKKIQVDQLGIDVNAVDINKMTFLLKNIIEEYFSQNFSNNFTFS